MYSEEGNNSKEQQIFRDKFCGKEERNLEEIRATLEMEEILLKLFLNWDQADIKLVASTGSMTMEEQGARRIELVGLNDK